MHQPGDGRADDVRVLAQVHAEERTAGDGKREPHELGVDIERRSVTAARRMRLPPPKHELGGVRHGSGQRFDTRVVERRLAHPPLPPPGLALAADQAVADHLSGAVVEEASGVVPPAVLEHVADVVRVRQLVEQERPDVIAEHVAVEEQAIHQEAERVAPSL